MTAITFGTDGWRAIVGQDFIPENILKVTQAFCDLYPKLERSGSMVVVGHDRRNQSPEAAQLIASCLVGNNIRTILSDGYCPTPAVSWSVKARRGTAGIMVTASHNPPQWNGIKFKEATGGAASGDFCRPIEERIAANDRAARRAVIAALNGHNLFARFDPFGEYLGAIRRLIDIDRIKRQNYRILVEPLFGAGCGFFPRLLGDHVEEMHNAADPNFGGLNPEPIPPYVHQAMERVKRGNYHCAIITDGDADRAGAIDENGNFVSTHEFYCLLIRHAVEHKGLKGTIIKSISTTRMVERLGKKLGCEVLVTPVGFKYISPAMNQAGVMCGGEESGGFGFPHHLPERDGIYSNLLLLELMATTGKTLGTLVADLQHEVGPCCYRRIDYHLPPETLATTRAKFHALDIRVWNGKNVVKHTTLDGHHFLFDDDSWLLFRASGTEPLIRTYAEAATSDQVEGLLAAAKCQLGL